MKTAKGQITLVTIPEQISYELQSSVTQIMIDTDGTISTPTITCTAYKIEGSVRTTLSAQEGTIKYKTSNDLTYLNYDTVNGVTVNAQWSFITFFLFLIEDNDPIVRFDVPITRNGQVDTNFRVWVGTEADPNTLLLYPWIGEQNESQETYMHVQDYYMSPDMTYYCFVNNGTELNPVYEWDEVTDATLKRWLERANNSTTGFIVTYHEGTAVNTDVLNFFQNRNYVIGDLWSNAKYTTTQNNEIVYLYDDEPLICKQSKTNGFNIDDWQPISAIKTKLKDTGIDIDENKVTITADETWAVNNAGERVAIINTVDGHPKITASLLQINGDVLIEGGAIIEAVGNSSEAQENLIDLLSDNNIIPTTVTHNNDGTVTVLSGNDLYVTYTKNAIDNSDFVKFDVQNGSGNSSFTLNKNGLLTADNAVIYGEIHATKGDFVGELSSAGGSFNVDKFGNVVATSFNGKGILMPGTVVITEDNFYDYFMQSLLDINNGSETDYDGFPYNKRWIPNLKKIQNIVYFESVPQSAMYTDSLSNLLYLIIVLPHYFKKTTGNVLETSCRRGGLTRLEMMQLHENKYTFSQSSNSNRVVCIFATAIGGDLSVLTNDNDGYTSALYQYRSTNTFTYPELISTSISADSDLWQDIESTATAQYENSTLPDVQNQITECYVNLYYVLHTSDTMCFKWECSSAINIEDIGNLAIRYYYPVFENGVAVTTNDGVFAGDIVNGHISNNTVVQDADGSYQHGYLCITQYSQNSIPNAFDLAKCRFSKTVNGIKYIITI